MLPHLGRLQELCLEGNRLTALPEAIGGLGKLRELWVRYLVITPVVAKQAARAMGTLPSYHPGSS